MLDFTILRLPFFLLFFHGFTKLAFLVRHHIFELANLIFKLLNCFIVGIFLLTQIIFLFQKLVVRELKFFKGRLICKFWIRDRVQFLVQFCHFSCQQFNLIFEFLLFSIPLLFQFFYKISCLLLGLGLYCFNFFLWNLLSRLQSWCIIANLRLQFVIFLSKLFDNLFGFAFLFFELLLIGLELHL